MSTFLSFIAVCSLSLFTTPIVSFIVPPISTTTIVTRTLFGSSSSSDADEPLSEEKRMEYVRSLQKSFYQPSSDDDDDDDEMNENNNNNLVPKVDKNTGIITNLPLWRVGWVELPGRANCLNVHESQYTHMFETILNSNSRFVGHLHLPGGFQSAVSGDRRFELKTWGEELNEQDEQEERSAVVGTLMRISDFRRMEDGRLTLLVHPVERFVVHNVVRHFPYSVADVQMLPDNDFENNRRNNRRARAVHECFQYMDYEHDTTIKLPLPTDEEYVSLDVDVTRMGARDLANILPFAFYSRDDSSLDHIFDDDDDDDQSTPKQDEELEPPLEKQLENGGILSVPSFIAGAVAENRRSLDSATLERLLWMAMDEFCRITRFRRFPNEILCLVPSQLLDELDHVKMSDDPAVVALPKTTTPPTPPPPRPLLSVKYPPSRRRRRLSYSAPALLESLLRSDLRQMCLCIPSTRQRLAVVLERFELVNDILRQQQGAQDGQKSVDDEFE